MQELHAAVKSVNSNAEILGEYWGDPSPWLDDGTEWNSAMNYNGFTLPVSEWICGVDYHGNSASINESSLESSVRTTRSGSRRAAAPTSGRPISGSSFSSPTPARPPFTMGTSTASRAATTRT